MPDHPFHVKIFQFNPTKMDGGSENVKKVGDNDRPLYKGVKPLETQNKILSPQGKEGKNDLS